MIELKIKKMCKINNLIDVIAERTGKSYSEIEEMVVEENVYPANDTVYFDIRWPSDSDGPFRKAVHDLLRELNIQGIYVSRDC